jgi:uncharacterized protein YgbK (DUF1537 family)
MPRLRKLVVMNATENLLANGLATTPTVVENLGIDGFHIGDIKWIPVGKSSWRSGWMPKE